MKLKKSRSIPAIAMLTLAVLACSGVPSLPGVGSTSLLKDDFSSESSGWGTGTDSQSSVEYDNGGLRMQSYSQNLITWSGPDDETYQDVHLEVTVKGISQGTPPKFGVMCNQQVTEKAYYYFAVTSDGQYAIARSPLVGDDVFLTNNDEWATSDLIPKNADSYRVGADCGGGTLTLYVNGQKIDSASDTEYEKGGVGLFIWTGEDPTGEVTYDDFVMTSLK